MASLSFERVPHVGMLALALKRGRRLAAGESIPRIEAKAARLDADLATYTKVCGLPGGAALPLCFPQILAADLQKVVLTHRDFPLALFGVVHTRQRIEQKRALYVNEALGGRVWVEGHRPARRGGEFDLHTVITAGGDDVWHGITTILSQELPGDGQKRPPPQPTTIQAGRACTWDVPENQGRRYAKVSGDNNPIHQYALTARPFGFKRAIVHGWWTLARAMAEMDTDVPAACVLECAFHAPVSLPSTVYFRSGVAGAGLAFELRGAPGKSAKTLVTGSVVAIR